MTDLHPRDRRFIKTERAIRSAFIDLVAKKGFDELSVKDIVDAADIGRGTFYLHYKDKYALLETFEIQIGNDLREIIRGEVFPLTEGRTLTKTVVALFTYFEENIQIMRALFGENGSCSFQSRLKDRLWHDVFAEKLVTVALQDSFSVPLEYLLAYINASHFNVFLTWIQKEGPERESPDEIARIILKISLLSPYRIR
ncbi:MAG: TetR/AcrR family transcriptional regulator C-terminal domain-containing protein [Methanocorpusculum sp.]|uniref:TetR/AcrR family transcriptional regulator n=1 Tax=Methanocorpusculum sp. TaxID=2058474 RepID=UPI002723BDCE|nr:TetR family transcriptional regulator [Methanocorpusculum sp.]MDO9523014.1 TetR/AcrR family transcriptional regulator C-terminal domain-containing protein [Methanocorpusculum sp.]